jgi:C_GCAxxG_C_C family probable redox protein
MYLSKKQADEAARLARLHFTPAAEGEPHFNCAESVLLATAEALNIRSGAVPRAASAFGGGMARQGNACGAITGSLIAIGLARGRESKTEPREPSYEPGADLQQRFLARFGAGTCRELTGCDITTPEGYAAYAAAGGNQRCGDYVEFAARTVAELLGD